MADFNGEKDYVILQRRLMMYVWYMRVVECSVSSKKITRARFFFQKMVNSNQA